MYLIIMLLLFVLVGDCRAQEVTQFLNGRGYEKGNFRVWRNIDGSIQGCYDTGASMRASQDLSSGDAEQLFHEFVRELEEVQKQERLLREERERAEREEQRRIIKIQQRIRRRQIEDDIYVWNIMKVGLGCFILMISLQIMFMLSEERGPRMAGF